MIVGAGGQIGSELVPHLRSIYGNNNVVAADISAEKCKVLAEAGPFEELNALDGEKYTAIVKKYGIDTIFNLVALLSATGEKIRCCLEYQYRGIDEFFKYCER